MNAPVTIKGWCPSALRPMMSGDGLLVRVRVRDATLAPADALALADLSQRFGNGAIDLTRRANLQIRGVREAQWPALIDALRARDLIGVDEELGQAVNIVMSPLAGLDPTLTFDPRPIAWTIEQGLLADERFRGLPSKFGFAFDGGGALPLDDADADIRVGPVQGSPLASISLAGSSHVALIEACDAAQASLAFAGAFLDLRDRERRMHALVERMGAAPIFAKAGMDAVAVVTAPERETMRPLGLSHCADMPVLGVAAPFGAWNAGDLTAVATMASTVPDATLRVTPWRALLVVGLPQTLAMRGLDELAVRGLIVSPDDPRLAVAACVGAPSCAAASGVTRDLAERLASSIRPSSDIVLHVSGCAKGCAHPHPAAVTLVGRDERFDLVENDRPSGVPTIHSLALDDMAEEVRKRLPS